MNTFEDFLKNKHMELFPEVLDDDLPDAYEAWHATLNPGDIVKYSQEMLENN